MTDTTRFAPSPTGCLHLGHAYAAIYAARHGNFLLRIEDIDSGRCRSEFEQDIYDDLAWLGLRWPAPARRQSEHIGDYRAALEKLRDMDVLYPCFCTRKDIEAAASAPHGPDGPLYPGTCRRRVPSDREARIAGGAPYAWRLNVARARALAPARLRWRDRLAGWQDATPEIFGDVVLARKEQSTSYHLSVTVDDALQGVTLVTRGDDLFPATHLHRLLQSLLGLAVPEWQHHKMLLDADGKRFAKRNHSVTLRHLRETDGLAPADIYRLTGIEA